MPQTMTQSLQSDPVRELDSIRPAQAKAGLRSDGIGLNRVIAEAVIAHYGSVKAAAFSLGEGAHLPALDPSLMMREFKEGKFGRLNAADGETKAAIARAMTDTFGTLTTPKARVRDAVRTIRRHCDEIDQYLEFLG